MQGDSLCERCQHRKAWLDARDKFYQAAFEHGNATQRAEAIAAQAERQLWDCSVLKARLTSQTATMNQLIEDLKKELSVTAEAAPRPWWRFW